jgi:hypothetical protein
VTVRAKKDLRITLARLGETMKVYIVLSLDRAADKAAYNDVERGIVHEPSSYPTSGYATSCIVTKQTSAA